MARRFTRGRGHLGSSRRESQWFQISPNVDTAAGGAAVLVGTFNAAALELRPFTIVRTYLEIEFGSDQSIAGEAQIGAIGMCVVNDQATAAGIASLPAPVSVIGSDLWFVHRSMLTTFAFGDNTGF